MSLAERVLGLISRIELISPTIDAISAYVGRHMLERMIQHYNQHKSVYFDVPPSLSGQWNLAPAAGVT